MRALRSRKRSRPRRRLRWKRSRDCGRSRPPAAGAPNLVLPEAGPGGGQSLGYFAPASLWAAKNEGTLWRSTYTRYLQHQIDGELDRLYPTPKAKA